jgi:hypothetical protein
LLTGRIGNPSLSGVESGFRVITERLPEDDYFPRPPPGPENTRRKPHMTATMSITSPARVRRLVHATLFAAALALGGSTLASAAVASADPDVAPHVEIDQPRRELPRGRLRKGRARTGVKRSERTTSLSCDPRSNAPEPADPASAANCTSPDVVETYCSTM